MITARRKKGRDVVGAGLDRRQLPHQESKCVDVEVRGLELLGKKQNRFALSADELRLLLAGCAKWGDQGAGWGTPTS